MAESKIDLQLAFDNLKQQFKSLKTEVKTKEDQLCEHQRQLDLIKVRELHFLHEIEVLQSSEKPEVDKLHGRIKQLEDDLSHLNANFDSEMLKQDEELDRLQDELKSVKMHSEETAAIIDPLPTTAGDVSEENLVLENELEILNEKLFNKQMCLDRLEVLNTKLLESVNNLHVELEHVQESAECKKQELKEAYDLMNTLQETILTTKTELKGLKGKPIIVNKNDDNSLFAEVNDGRLKLQEILLNLSEKCNKMKLEISKKQKQICTLRLYNEELTSVLKNDPIEYQQDYETMIDTYTSRISILNNLSEEYKSLILEKEDMFIKGIPRNITEFLNNINEKTRKMEQELNDTAGMEFRVQKMMSIQLREILLNIQKWDNTICQLQSKSSDCEMNIQKLKLQRSNPSIVIKEADEGNANKSESPSNTNNENKCEVKQSLVDECSKENSPQIANTSEIKPNEKRVEFSADTKSSSNHTVRRGGKILQCKSIHIPSRLKKN